MNAKTTLVLIALIGVGLFALPQTTALFAGQHSFVNIDETGNQIECVKCHGDVRAELTGALDTHTNTSGPHAEMKCEFCHRLQIGQSSGDSAFALITYANTEKTVYPNGSISFSKATKTRYAVIASGDYEAGQYPETINMSDPIAYNLLPGGSRDTLNFYNGTAWVAASSVWGTLKTPGQGASFSPENSTDSTVLNSLGTALCGGELINASDPSAGFKNQAICVGSGGKIFPLLNTSTDPVSTLDTNTTTMNTAFTPRYVTFYGTALKGKLKTTTQADILAGVKFDGAGSRAVNKGSKYHAASLVACLDCHGGSSPSYAGHETERLSMECQDCHYGGETATAELGTNKWTNLEAGGFGMGLTNAATDSGSAEVHKSMVVAQDSISVYGGRYAPASNDACIACHTHVDVEITFTRPTTLTYNAVETLDGTIKNWNETGFGVGPITNETTG
jgi:hypothetical protein